ncbi:unnamed protein product [Trichogramma brassicae]|uniref:Uncharacterized protein n=1 Tax=Trichogramma brassicae TaxID=86971 RepID=A0A6H5IFV3_9HYME|nr:unnamed protein product [Trichogramma brassicae]
MGSYGCWTRGDDRRLALGSEHIQAGPCSPWPGGLHYRSSSRASSDPGPCSVRRCGQDTSSDCRPITLAISDRSKTTLSSPVAGWWSNYASLVTVRGHMGYSTEIQLILDVAVIVLVQQQVREHEFASLPIRMVPSTIRLGTHPVRGCSSSHYIRLHGSFSYCRGHACATTENFELQERLKSALDRPAADSARRPMRIAEDGTSLLCKTAPDICASNPQSAISYVEKADLSAHMLPAYPETKIVESRFVAAGQNFPVQDQSDPNAVIDSRPSGYVDKEGNLVDSRLLSETSTERGDVCRRQRASKLSRASGERFSDFPLPPVETTTIVTNDQPQQQSVQQQPPLAFADKEAGNFIANGEHSIVVDSLDIQYSYDSRYNNLAGQTVPITLKHHHPHHRQGHTQASQQYVHQNCGTIHSGMLRVAEPGTSSSNQRSMTLQNPKRKIISNTQIAQNTFSTLECENRRGRGVNVDGRNTGQVASAKVYQKTLDQINGKYNFNCRTIK